MQFQQLRHLLTVVEHGSLATGAKALGLSQPALSKSLKRLEDSLGVRLLERGPRGVLPTEFGRQLVQHARAITVEMHEAERAIGAIRDGVEGRVAIGSAPSVIASVLPIAIGRLMRRSPELKITVVGSLHDRLFEWLRDGEIDAVLSNLAEDALESDLEQEVLYTDRVVVAARPGHRLIGRRGRHRTAIASARWVLPPASIITRQRLEAQLRANDLPPPKVAIETNALAFMRAMIMETDCVGFLPAVTLRAGRECAGLVPIGATWLDWDRPVGLTVRRSGQLTPACRRLIAELRRVCRSHGGVDQAVRHKPARGASRRPLDSQGLV